ncbi:MAG: hypothetical protein JXA95_18240 [Spirochaetales bacterium]|nr:hypothetical protein [Spirochaetales bacterium]
MSSEKTSGGFLALLQNLFGGLLGGGGDREKKRLLKDIQKDLKRSGKFYKVGGNMAQPQMARFFHDLYKGVGPVYALFSPYISSDLLKYAFIQVGMKDEDKMLDERLTETSLRERAKLMDLKTLRGEVKADLIRLYSLFDGNKIRLINSLYNHFLALMDFAGYDYYFFLKKFDSGLPEGDFVYSPRFEAINGEYLLEDLKDFLTVLEPIESKTNWGVIFDILKNYREMDLMPASTWKKLMRSCDDVRNTGVFKLIIMHLSEDPYYKITRFGHSEEIVESYLDKKKREVEQVLNVLLKEKKNSQIEVLVKAVFGTTAVSRTQNYTSKANINFSKKGVDGFLHVDGINYLKAFFLDTYKSKIRNLIDILLIEGKWSTNVTSQQFSENYHLLLEIADQVVFFDNDLAEDGTGGGRLKRYFRMVNPQDRSSQNSMNKIIAEINEEAYLLVKKSSEGFISMGKMLKQLIEDYKVANHQVIINWKELDGRTDNSIESQMTEIYKQLYYFVQLIQYSLKG